MPEHVPLYQYQFAPVPKLPPVMLKVVVPLSHIVDSVAVAELAEVEPVFNSITLLAQAVELHAFSALT